MTEIYLINLSLKREAKLCIGLSLTGSRGGESSTDRLLAIALLEIVLKMFQISTLTKKINQRN